MGSSGEGAPIRRRLGVVRLGSPQRFVAVAAFAAAAAAAAPACNLTGVWQSVGSNDPITVLMDATTFAFTATAQSGFSNQPGQYFPANASLTFTCCGGIAGSVDAACDVIQWRDANSDAWARGAPQGAALSTPLYTVGLGFGPGLPPSVDTFAIFGAGAKTSNFALTGQRMAGGSQLLPARVGRGAGGDVTPRCSAGGGGCLLHESPASVTLTGIELADPAAAGGGAIVATEAWTLRQLNDSAFSFEVRRTWTAAAEALSVDRVAIALRTTGGLPIHSEQIPGFVDLDVFVNASSTGGFDLGNGAFEFLSPNAQQFVRFTPTGALFVVEGAATLGGAAVPVFFSFAKPFADGTADCSIGFELIDPRTGPRNAPANGTVEVVTLTFNSVETDIPTGGAAGLGPFPRMDVALANASLQAQMETLMGAQYQLLGWLMGNNPASVPCLHEMAWWPMMSSVFPSASRMAVRAMQQELSFFAGCGWTPYAWSGGTYEYVHSCSLADGARFGLTQRYASSGFYNCPWGPLTDQDVMFPIAVYYAATSSGDMAWLASLRPALDAVEAFLAQSGLALGGAGPAVFVSPASGLADGGRHTGNWFVAASLPPFSWAFAGRSDPFFATPPPRFRSTGTTSLSSATSTRTSPCTACGP